jgi:hypothetical protein
VEAVIVLIILPILVKKTLAVAAVQIITPLVTLQVALVAKA